VPDVPVVSSLYPFIVIGITEGSIFALAALGLVLTYRTSGIFNFAHGAIAAAAAGVFYTLHVTHGLPWPIAAAITVFGFGALVGVLLEFAARGLGDVSTTAKLVATIGLLLAVQAALVVIYGSQNRPFPSFLPTTGYRLGGVNVSWEQTITVVVALVSVVGLYVFLRRTRTGVAMRAVVESSDLLGLTGTSAPSVRRAAWVIGGMYAAVSGLLLAPRVGLDSLTLTLLVVQAFGAAAVGAFTSLPLTYLGGLLVGLGDGFAQRLVASVGGSSTWMQGLPPSVPFLVLFAVLLLSPKRRLQEAGAAVVRQMNNRVAGPEWLRRAGVVVVAVAAVTVPLWVGPRLPVYTSAAAYVAVFASLGLLVRTSGQISLAQIGFAAVGGAAIAHFTTGWHLPWLLALLLAGAVAVPIGAIVAIPAIRLAGLYLALATFGFGILLDQLGYRTRWMFGPTVSVSVPRPDFGPISADSRRAYYYVVLGVVAAVLALIVVVERSRLGRLLRGLADSPIALTTRGTNVNVTRVLVFCISSFVAAVGGALLAGVNGQVTGSTYPYFASLVLLAVLVSVGPGTVRSPVLATVAFVVFPSYLTNPTLVDGLPILFGVSAILVASSPYDFSGVARRLAGPAARWATRNDRSPSLERLAEVRWPALPQGRATTVVDAVAAATERSR
jgi:branched-subunit amino acid ABC-type transport system permease component